VPSTSFEVKCDNPSFTESANFGHPKKVGNLPGKLLNLSAVIPNGKRKLTSTVEADLLINDSLSYVIVQDMYGRIIPAIMPNAKLD
jgi:hypothetical protein